MTDQLQKDAQQGGSPLHRAPVSYSPYKHLQLTTGRKRILGPFDLMWRHYQKS